MVKAEALVEASNNATDQAKMIDLFWDSISFCILAQAAALSVSIWSMSFPDICFFQKRRCAVAPHPGPHESTEPDTRATKLYAKRPATPDNAGRLTE
jgi:hypothetical protein